MPVGHLGMTASLAQKTRFELRGDLAATAAFPGRELDHGSPRNPPVREPRNRVVQVRRFGGPDGLEVVDAPLPRAGRGEVRVRMLASGLEYTDVVIRRRLYPQTMRRRPPFVLGYDVVGEIDQLGDGVSGFELGDRVADLTVLGSNAAYCTLADRLTRVPAGVDAAEAAALILRS
jgi:NADPH:quinone reductase